MKTDSFSNQLRWVVLLLAAAVILPTVCLLWFMNQALENVQLSVHSKLIDVYKKQYEISRGNFLEDDYVYLNICLPYAKAILIYDDHGTLTFPVPNHDTAEFDDAIFSHAFKLEYADNDPNAALAEYDQIVQNAEDPLIQQKARISQTRCLRKLNRINEAITKLYTITSEYPDNSISLRIQKCHAFLLLLELTKDNPGRNFEAALSQTYDFLTAGMATDDDLQFLGEPEYLQNAIPSSLHAFAFKKFLDYAEAADSSSELSKKIKRVNKLLSIMTLSMEIAKYYDKPTFADGSTVVSSAVFNLETDEALYGAYLRTRNHIRLRVFSREQFEAMLQQFIEDIKTFPTDCWIYDEKGNRVAGSEFQMTSPPRIKMPVSEWLPGWQTHLYIRNTAFDKAASKQAAIYIWAGILVIVLVIISGALTIGTVNRQIKMNRLKNDFIATVTHELKTPLSSMRLLVDTLLEGRYKDESTVNEYLQLVSNENKRLTHLIDSFLTFSRMERNKQVFDFCSVSPGEMATAAIEAMQAKLSADDCHFTHHIEDDLPAVNADVDGMVTVLVNLLDNACKYTNGDKEITLNVYAQNGQVCFAVSDNGIGISKRIQKKIFNRFYQVDSRLSRRSEGCGLGLSIVHFIVGAHRGTIELQSELNKGSTFTVKLPAV